MSKTGQKPTLCMVHEGIGTMSAIAKVAMSGVVQALDAGWQVTVVAEKLDESLVGRVEWLRLYVPPRLFLVKWLAARSAIAAALGGRTFDVLHVHQPQVADRADVMQCHYLTRVAHERRCLETRPGPRAGLIRAQEQGVLRAEDFFFRRWNPRTRMLFDSALTRREFARLYGMPAREDVLLYPFPPLDVPTDEERREARRRMLGGDVPGLVVGYLGGVQERKGYPRLLRAVESDPDLFLLMGGSYTDGFQAPSLGGRFKATGLVGDTATFYAACDVFAVPSLFEPLGLVAFEAAARGVPVVATEEVGALPHLLEYGAGAAWDPARPLGPLARDLAARRDEFRAGARRMADDLSERRYGERLLRVYEDVLREKRARSLATAGAGGVRP